VGPVIPAGPVGPVGPVGPTVVVAVGVTMATGLTIETIGLVIAPFCLIVFLLFMYILYLSKNIL
jgi:hypothetical protein